MCPEPLAGSMRVTASGLSVPGVMFRKLRFDLVGLLGGLDIVLHLPLELGGRIGPNPLRPQRVLDQVLRDPVGREELGRSRNVN